VDLGDVKRFLRQQACNAYRLGSEGARRAAEWYRRPDVQARREDLLDRTRARLNQGKGLVLGLAAGAGGAVAGSAFPDLDIRLLGIGSHRNWFFHSGIATYALGKAGDKMIEHYKELASEGDDSLKAKAVMELERYVGAPFVAGFALGQTIHLGLDALVQRGKDVLGFPVEQLLSGGRTLDAIYLLGNGLWAFSGAGRFIAFALTGEAETERLLEWLRGLRGARAIAAPGSAAPAIQLPGA